MSQTGAIPPLRLLEEVASDYPANPVVLQAIREQLSETSLDRAETVIDHALRSKAINPIDIDFTELNDDGGELRPALAVQLAGKTEEEQKSFLTIFKANLKEKAAPALANTLIAGAVKWIEQQLFGG